MRLALPANVSVVRQRRLMSALLPALCCYRGLVSAMTSNVEGAASIVVRAEALKLRRALLLETPLPQR